MFLFDQDALEQLMAVEGNLCLSVYMPTYRRGADVQQNPIRFKNLLRQVEEELIENGLRRPEAEKMLAEARTLQEDYNFWQHQMDGLALFTTHESFEYFRLPLHFEEMVLVADRFHVKPLLPLFIDNGRFYILALSQNDVRLLRGTRDSVAEIDLQDVPQSLAEALWFDDPEKQLQHHTSAVPSAGEGTTGGTGRGPAIFHGHGVGDGEAEKERLLRYFHRVDDGLSDLLSAQQAPLILAGVAYLFPIYHEANSYQYLMDEGIPGNPDELSGDELHHQAWQIVAPHFREVYDEAIAHYKNLSATERVSSSLDEIVPAAHYGRVHALFAPLHTEQWGTFNQETGMAEPHAQRERGDVDLLDLAAVQTLRNSGTVFAVEEGEIPDGATIAAIFRH